MRAPDDHDFPKKIGCANEVSCGLPRVSQRTPLGDFRGLATNEANVSETYASYILIRRLK